MQLKPSEMTQNASLGEGMAKGLDCWEKEKILLENEEAPKGQYKS